MYIVVSGKIGLFADDDDTASEMARIGPGQIIGDLAFFTGNPRTAFARAITDVEFHKIPYETVRRQFDAVPPWVQLMTKTLANQVQSYSNEIRMLKDAEEGVTLSKLAVARGWAALTFVPMHYGTKYNDSLTIDWPTLRTHANLSFREISTSVMQLARILQSLGYCIIRTDNHGPTDLEFTEPEILTGFLKYYVRAVTKNNPELSRMQPIEYNTLQLLANREIKVLPIHRGQVEIDLVKFKEFADASGHPEVTAVSVDLLVARGIDVSKIATETSVKLRYHQEEVTNLAKYWQIVSAIQKLNRNRVLSKKAG